MFKKYVKYILPLLLVTLVCTFLVALTYELCKPIIDENALKRENETIMELFPDATLTTLDPKFNQNELDAGLVSLMKADTYYVYKASVIGLYAGEKTTFLVVIDNKGNFSHFKVISSEDTDYISKVDAEQFRSRFINKDYSTEFDGADMETRATLSANPVASAIMAAGNNYGRLFKNG